MIRALALLLAALPGLLAMACTVVAIAVLFGWPWALLAAVPFLLVIDSRIRPPRRDLADGVR